MIIGIGVDIVDINRIEKWKNKKGLLERFFHPEEIQECMKRGLGQISSLSARFAAKEAYGKALGCGLKGIRLRDIQVVTNTNGKPDIVVHETAKIALHEVSAEKIFVSLSHEKDKAIAMVILEK